MEARSQLRHRPTNKAGTANGLSILAYGNTLVKPASTRQHLLWARSPQQVFRESLSCVGAHRTVQRAGMQAKSQGLGATLIALLVLLAAVLIVGIVVWMRRAPTNNARTQPAQPRSSAAPMQRTRPL